MNSSTEVISSSNIITFWLNAGPDRWFKKDVSFDDEIRRRFLTMHEIAAAGELKAWEQDAIGTLALIILLDQFPRNMFRGQPRAFSTDALARAIAAGALMRGFDALVPQMLRTFFYLPFQHSEDIADQERGIALYKTANNIEGLKWAELHADIIRRFGRFPHRNAILGRATTPEERAFLEDGGFAG
jgi:uncharacterized protein (DUF924 family)